MNSINPFPALACLIIALNTVFFLGKESNIPLDKERFASIDGLRGYLAFFVFLHHSCIWYFYLHTGQWDVPPSNLYTNFGQGGVLLFLMITGFLFFSKIIEGKTTSIDWGRLFISRLLRLVPLYLFSVFLLLIIITVVSKGVLKVPIDELISSLLSWLCFTVFGMTDLNDVENSFIVVAGVVWTLPCEWFFYFSLPILALLVGVVPPRKYILFSMASIIGMMTWWTDFDPLLLIPFSGGILASFLVRFKRFCQLAESPLSSILVLGCFSVAVGFYPSVFVLDALLLLSIGFILIACGNDIFGVLTKPVSRKLGMMAYSLYLLHGITLFVTFNFILGLTASKSLSPIGYWLLIGCITPILVTGCYFTFRLIESPAMHKTGAVTAWIRSRK